jgi:ABC-type lipoprotein release transport system permease subunit
VFSRVAVQVGLGVVLGAFGATMIAPLSVVAAYGPARRSLRIQPAEAVRAE